MLREKFELGKASNREKINLEDFSDKTDNASNKTEETPQKVIRNLRDISAALQQKTKSVKGEKNNASLDTKIVEAKTEAAWDKTLEPTPLANTQTRDINTFNSSDASKKYFHTVSQNIINDGLVQEAKLLLRENGRGQIRLQLTPKALGEVELVVKLDDNVVSTKVVVATNEAKEFMQKSLDNLVKEFYQEGYEIGEFSVLVNSDSSDNQSGEQHSFQNKAKHRMSCYLHMLKKELVRI